METSKFLLPILLYLAVVCTIILIIIFFKFVIKKHILHWISENKLKKLTLSQKKIVTSKLIDTIRLLSSKRLGALIVIEQHVLLEEYANRGYKLNADFSPELVQLIFNKSSPFHDGAMILRGNKILSVCCYLPTSTQKLKTEFGSRHRAALGVSEISDAITIVVSETNGDIACAYKKDLFFIDDPYDVYDFILFKNLSKGEKKSFKSTTLSQKT